MMIRTLSGCSDLEPVSQDELADDWTIAHAELLDETCIVDQSDPSGLTGLTGLGLAGLTGLTGLGLSGLGLSALTATISFDFE